MEDHLFLLISLVRERRLPVGDLTIFQYLPLPGEDILFCPLALDAILGSDNCGQKGWVPLDKGMYGETTPSNCGTKIQGTIGHKKTPHNSLTHSNSVITQYFILGELLYFHSLIHLFVYSFMYSSIFVEYPRRVYHHLFFSLHLFFPQFFQ